MPPVSADRLRHEIEFLLSRNDPDQLSQREFRNKLEQVLCLEEGALENDKELVNRLVQDFWAKDVKERPVADHIELEVQAEEADGWHFVRRWSLKADRRQQPLRCQPSKGICRTLCRRLAGGKCSLRFRPRGVPTCVQRKSPDSRPIFVMAMNTHGFDLIVKNTFYTVPIEEEEDSGPGSPMSPGGLRRQESSPAMFGRRCSKGNKVDFPYMEDGPKPPFSRRISTEDILSSTTASQSMEWWDVDEHRTSVMIKNLPQSCTIEHLQKLLDDAGFSGSYDFLYLPMKFISKLPFGYAFVNLVNPDVTREFWVHFDGYNCCFGDEDSCLAMSWSTDIQGLDEHVARYRNSPVMHPSVSAQCKPLLFKDQGDQGPSAIGGCHRYARQALGNIKSSKGPVFSCGSALTEF
eukprot:s1701_g8.t1